MVAAEKQKRTGAVFCDKKLLGLLGEDFLRAHKPPITVSRARTAANIDRSIVLPASSGLRELFWVVIYFLLQAAGVSGGSSNGPGLSFCDGSGARNSVEAALSVLLSGDEVEFRSKKAT